MTIRRKLPMVLVFVATAAMAALMATRSAEACGGLFCENTPVNQSGERIVFTVNGDQTITSLIQIQYFGAAEDFSWILPIPEAIPADALQVPDDGDLVFNELHQLTDVRFIPPPVPACVERSLDSIDPASEADSAEVEVFASGEIGPFGFDVIGSDDPNALIDWLVGNGYRVDPPMEPLMNVYVEEEFAFVAMRLLNGETADSIQPIEITYPGTEAMIPLRLTAVAAQPQMPVWTWIFADAQAVPANYEHMQVATEEVTFNDFGGNDYTTLVQGRADALGGRAFITEYAAPAEGLAHLVIHPYLVDRMRSERYLTRLATYISPAEMTVDPVFTLDPDRPDVSNVRDASELEGLYRCERENGRPAWFGLSDAIDPSAAEGAFTATTPAWGAEGGDDQIPVGLIVGGMALLFTALIGYVEFNRRQAHTS